MAVADSVANGISLLNGSPVDVVVSDLGLPDGTGYEFLAAVRQTRPRVFAIAVSAYCMAADRAQSRRAGFDMHFAKPVDLVQLRLVLNDQEARARSLPVVSPPQD